MNSLFGFVEKDEIKSQRRLVKDLAVMASQMKLAAENGRKNSFTDEEQEKLDEKERYYSAELEAAQKELFGMLAENAAFIAASDYEVAVSHYRACGVGLDEVLGQYPTLPPLDMIARMKRLDLDVSQEVSEYNMEGCSDEVRANRRKAEKRVQYAGEYQHLLLDYVRMTLSGLKKLFRNSDRYGGYAAIRWLNQEQVAELRDNMLVKMTGMYEYLMREHGVLNRNSARSRAVEACDGHTGAYMLGY